ncbi:MAG TPA: J domain-containing protein [Treponemataceae bacterium]|nr:J domain-containing protein [Treponemataceae bacterium]
MTYSLEHLMKVQSPGIKKHPDFLKIKRIFRESTALKCVQLNGRAYRLLNEPRLELQYLENFYRTYRVPKSEFFTLFLSMKWGQIQKRASNRSARKTYIALQVESFPRDFLSLFNYLITLDGKLYPHTKKRINEMSAFTIAQWLSWFTSTLSTLMKKHRVLEKIGTEKVLACMLLESLPDFHSGKMPSKTQLKSQFRKLSKEHHPDTGGEGRRFLLIKKAYEELIKVLV